MKYRKPITSAYQRLVDENSNGQIIDNLLCDNGHRVYECGEADNVYCPYCDTYYNPEEL